MSKRIIFLIIGILISVVSLYFAFRGFDLGQVWAAITRVRLEFLLLAVLPYVVTFMAKVWRWQVMFHPDEKRARLGILFPSLMISYIPLPFRAGEIARGVVAARGTGVPAARVFSTIIVEKVLDVLTLLLFLGVSLPFVGLPQQLQGAALLMAVAVLGVSLVLLAMVVRPEWGRWLSRLVAARLPARFCPRIESATDQVLKGVAPLSNTPVAARLGGWSLATWGVNFVTVYLMLLSFNLTVTPLAAVVLVVVTNLSMAVPSAPGYVGPFELAVVAVLGVLGIGETDAQAFAIFYHFVGLVPVALLGVIAAIQQGIGMAAFQAKPDDPSTFESAIPTPPRGPQPQPLPRRSGSGLDE